MSGAVMAVKFDHITKPVLVPCTDGPHAFAFQRECGGEPLFRFRTGVRIGARFRDCGSKWALGISAFGFRRVWLIGRRPA